MTRENYYVTSLHCTYLTSLLRASEVEVRQFGTHVVVDLPSSQLAQETRDALLQEGFHVATNQHRKHHTF